MCASAVYSRTYTHTHIVLLLHMLCVCVQASPEGGKGGGEKSSMRVQERRGDRTELRRWERGILKRKEIGGKREKRKERGARAKRGDCLDKLKRMEIDIIPQRGGRERGKRGGHSRRRKERKVFFLSLLNVKEKERERRRYY